MTRIRIGLALLLSTTAAVVIAQQGPPPAPGGPPAQASPKPDTPEITAMIAQVRQRAGTRWADTERFWCEMPRANQADDPPLTPTKILDNVYIIGNAGTAVHVIQTSAGLVMIDALGTGTAAATTAQLESQLLPGFQKVGLDPAQVKIIVVGHGHGDHYGGSSYFQERYGAKVYVSAVDWNLMENPPARRGGGAAPSGPPTPLPKRDGELKDGEPITLGDFTITPIAVPGHTPGSMGFIFPVKDQGRNHVAALFGGTWLTPQILSDEALQTFLTSAQKFQEATRRANVDTLLVNHPLMVPIQDWVQRVASRKRGEPNPFVVGKDDYQKFLGVLEGCTGVNIARRKA